MPHNLKLKELICMIRNCKTAAEERNVVSKECAQIRTAFKNEVLEYRTRNVAKILYLYMLGYPAHFGQLEVLKLISSSQFLDKRLGYLGAMLLLDEQSDLQLLLTNCLKSDLNSRFHYVTCTALCTLGNICSTDMARDLAVEVENLLKSHNRTIVKKAALCACRLVRKSPELVENFLFLVEDLLDERYHGLMLTGVTLLIEMCLVSKEALQFSYKLLGKIIRILKMLLTCGYSPENEIGGITDPFLQVKLIQLLGVLGHVNPQASSELNSVLTQVSSHTQSFKNAGNAVLYETVRAIFKVKADDELKIFAINILGRFLSGNDKNIRYIALNSLIRCVHVDIKAVQRHRDTIIECLKDLDVSIRRRALELLFVLINRDNIGSLTHDILQFLHVCESEFKPYICTQLVRACLKDAPSGRWYVDTVLQCLKLAGSYFEPELVCEVIRSFGSLSELHSYISRNLFLLLEDDISAQPVVQISVWCIGEFGEVLPTPSVKDEPHVTPTEETIIDLLESILQSSTTSSLSREYLLTALAKLSARFPATTRRIRAIMEPFTSHIDVELQQRSLEYVSLFEQHALRDAILERMPLQCAEESRLGKEEASLTYKSESRLSAHSPLDQHDTKKVSEATSDLLALFGSDTGRPAFSTVHNEETSATPGRQPTANSVGGLLSLFDEPTALSAADGINVYRHEGIEIRVQSLSSSTEESTFLARISNAGPFAAESFVMQIAVPKSMNLKLYPASSNYIPANTLETVTQKFQIFNASKQTLRLRIKVSYVLNGKRICDIQDVNELS
ncbi:AP-1 complex subunit gamma-1-like [Zophobas morio]|uniref:AP-1 complex subunit gamma-1-like n=1 Tax=Zophobas morio TaxID=2755281 RepID=UPI003083C255